jgi:predicted metal-binding membrane protein
VAVLLVLDAAAWTLTADRMAGMDAGPGSELGGVGWFAVSWLVMMAAMMLPALTPMVVAYARRAVRPGATAAFAAGYLVAWLAAGLVGYAAVEAVRSLEPGFLAWNEAGRYVAAGVLAGAGLYQLTASKDACLRRCRDRRTFLQEHWRPGRLGALRMGMEHGGYCVGCSWALMAALFALGAMSLTWMALVAGLIAAERLLPRTARLGVALVLVALATSVALVPGEVPALTVPDLPAISSAPATTCRTSRSIRAREISTSSGRTRASATAPISTS